MTTERLTPVECRLEGRSLHGVALRYNEPARDRPEMFLPGAFQPIGDVTLNLMHDQGRPLASTSGGDLQVRDCSTQLELVASLRSGSAELSLLRRRALRGLSVEFRSLSEHRDSNGLRVISKAELPAIGLVDEGSYNTQVEVRARMKDAWLSGTISFGKRMQCECQGPSCSDVEFEVGAFEPLMEARDILAVGGGGFANVLGSTRRGTLLIDQTKKGLRVGLTNSTTDTARRVIEAAGVADIYVRPLIDLEASEYTDQGTTRVFKTAVTRALLVKPTTSSRGHTPAKVRGVQTRRRRRWL